MISVSPESSSNARAALTQQNPKEFPCDNNHNSNSDNPPEQLQHLYIKKQAWEI